MSQDDSSAPQPQPLLSSESERVHGKLLASVAKATSPKEGWRRFCVFKILSSEGRIDTCSGKNKARATFPSFSFLHQREYLLDGNSSTCRPTMPLVGQFLLCMLQFVLSKSPLGVQLTRWRPSVLKRAFSAILARTQ